MKSSNEPSPNELIWGNMIVVLVSILTFLITFTLAKAALSINYISVDDKKNA